MACGMPETTADLTAGSVAGKPAEVDIYIDTQYAITGCNKELYGKEPWNHCRDFPNAYLSTRVVKREAFLHNLQEDKRKRVEHEIQRIETTRKNFASHESKKDLIKELTECRQDWKREVVARLSQYEKEAKEQTARGAKRDRDLVLLKRLEAWASEPKMASKNDASRTSSGRHGSLMERVMRRQPQDGERRAYEDITPDERQCGTPEPAESPCSLEPLYGFKIGVIYFKKTESGLSPYTYRHKKLSGEFPNQKISAFDILENESDNPLSERCPDDIVRYFHFPTNNMSWIEKAVARYYREEPRMLDDMSPYSKKTRNTDKLLSREFWRGQMHGNAGIDEAQDNNSATETNPNFRIMKGEGGKWRSGPVHARHMRPRCLAIPRDAPPKDFALNGKAPISDCLVETSTTTASQEGSPGQPRLGKNLALFLPYLHWETSSRRSKMGEVIKEVTLIKKKDGQAEKQKLANIVSMTKLKSHPRHYRLGKYLMKLARVAEEMDYEADERLLRENVNKHPPLHIRRTLDQYYFLTLEDTSVRDRDQVVYRGTRAGRSHHTPRVVMVDQLWLWILDESTIITSFPRRWGRNKPDSSGVHKSLRSRLDALGNYDIKSVYHLALLIVDQCSRVFFDRTKPLDERPEVMDLFASAIGHVSELTSIAYDSFWRNTSLQARNVIPNNPGSSSHTKYLDINPEGTLLLEVQDIVEELKIMKRIYTNQWTVVNEFKRNLTHPDGKIRHGHGDQDTLHQILIDFLDHRYLPSNGTHKDKTSKKEPLDEDSVHEAGTLLELINERMAEIQDLQNSAMHTCQQLEGLLSLKQQQASIVEAKAALTRAEESVRQGRAIMAFTIVTIFFLPLGFFAAFFGMNNLEATQSAWMTLGQQVRYMFALSTIVVVISVSMAFSAWARAVLKLMVRVPLALIAEYTGIHAKWKKSTMNHKNLERRSYDMLEHVSRRRTQRKDRESRLQRQATANAGTSQQQEAETRLDADDRDVINGAHDKDEVILSESTRIQEGVRNGNFGPMRNSERTWRSIKATDRMV